jgi:hypothetical protein
VSQNLYDAHRQWAVRPPDERFPSLEVLYGFLNGRRRASDEETRPLSRIEVKHDAQGNLTLNGATPPANLSHWAFGQLCYNVGAPARYIRSLPPEIAKDCVSHGLKKSDQDCKLLLRNAEVGNRTAAAFTGPNYGRIWDADVAERLIRAVEGTGWHVPQAKTSQGSEASGLYASDRDMFIFMVNDENPVEIGDARLGRGFFCWNSETGAASFGLTTFLYNYVCGNHIVWGAEEVRELRIVHKAEAVGRFQKEAMPRLGRFVENRGLSDVIKDTVGRAMTQPVAEDLDKTLEWFKAKPFTRTEVVRAWEAGLAEGNDVTTLWGMVQGFTAHARTMPYTNWRVNLERRAGALLDQSM